MAKLTIDKVLEMQQEFIKAGIMKDPMSYTADELKYLNPTIPSNFIDDYVDVRDGKKKESDWDRYKLNIEDL